MPPIIGICAVGRRPQGRNGVGRAVALRGLWCAGCVRFSALERRTGGAFCAGRQAVKRPGQIGSSYQVVTKFLVFY